MRRIMKSELTKVEILTVSDMLFLKNGYGSTTIKDVCNELDGMSNGNLTHYFATKEILLSELIQKLCLFRQQCFEQRMNDGYSAIEAVCLEIASIVAVSDSDPIAENVYIEAYRSSLSLDIIRKYGVKRAKQIFSQFCTDFSDEEYTVFEGLVTGIIFSTIVKNPIPLERRLASLLERVLIIYKVPDDIRAQVLHKVMDVDYRTMAAEEYDEFKRYVESYNEQSLREIILSRSRRMKHDE